MMQALADRCGVQLDGAVQDAAAYREQQYDLLADTVRQALDMEQIYRMLEETT